MSTSRRPRRAPGEIRDAIVGAMTDIGRPASIREIHGAVEERLGGRVAASSIRSYLRLGTDATHPRFARVGHGRYKLASRR